MKYQILYLDPPWRFQNWSMSELEKYGEKWARRNGRSPYNVVSHDTMCNWDILSLMESSSLMFMWATYPKLQEAFDLVNAWNSNYKKAEQLKYKTVAFTWVKITKNSNMIMKLLPNKAKQIIINGGFHFGLGYWTRQNPELCLLFGRGKISRIDNHVENLVISPLLQHSAKPPEVRDRIVRLCGDLTRLELFARPPLPSNWSGTGLEFDNMDIVDFIEANR